MEAHSLDGTYSGHPRQTRLVADRLVEGPRVVPVEVIVPGLLARAEERHADVFERGQDRGQVRGGRRGGGLGLGPGGREVELTGGGGAI